MSLGRECWKQVRSKLTELLTSASSPLKDDTLRNSVLIPMKDVLMLLPCKVGDYTDFYASIDHATNLGKMFRPNEEPLKPNWKHLPVGYHGRASSVVVSGTDLKRPNGQKKGRAWGELPFFFFHLFVYF